MSTVFERMTLSQEELKALFAEEVAFQREYHNISGRMTEYKDNPTGYEQLKAYRTRLTEAVHAGHKREKRRNKAMQWIADATDAKTLRYVRRRISTEFTDMPDLQEELMQVYFARAIELGLPKTRDIPNYWHKTFDVYNMSLNELRQLIDGDNLKLQYIRNRITKDVAAEGLSDKHKSARRKLSTVRREMLEPLKQHGMYNHTTADNPQRRDFEVYRGINPPIFYMSEEEIREYVGTDLALVSRIRGSMNELHTNLDEHDTTKASQIARIQKIMTMICIEQH